MRTQATRHSDCTAHLHRSKRPSLFDPHGNRARRPAAAVPVRLSHCPTVGPSSSLDDQSHRTTELGGASDLIAEEHEGGVRLARQPRETHGRRTGEQGRAVEDDEGKGPAAQEHVCAPRGARGIVRADHPHAFRITQVHPIARVEGALGVDVRDPAMVRDRGLDEGASEGGLAASRWARDLREPAARQSSTEQLGIERRNPGRECGSNRHGGREEPNELGKGKGHKES